MSSRAAKRSSLVPRTATERSWRFRGDIEGLRAVAIGLVLLDHLFGFPHGGFIGVDVFFVISGFLITSLLLREVGKTGKLSLVNFVGRRVRRILPAAITVIVATVGLSMAVFFGARAQAILSDGVASALMVQNWQLIRTGADYFAAGGSSPLQHLWSLAVEEQFYLLWPLALVLVFEIVRRRGWSLRRSVGVVALVGVIASFLVSCYETAYKPGWSYFSPESRAWELLTGAILACVLPSLHIPVRWARALAMIGLVSLGVASLFIGPDTAFPGPWAVVPVVATVLVIIGGEPGGQLRLLTNPAVRYVGRISFSLYLWHFPVYVIVVTLLSSGAGAGYIALALTLVLAAMTYRYIERPAARVRVQLPIRGVARRITVSITVLALVALAAGQLANTAWSKPATATPTPTPTTPISTTQIAQDVQDALTAPDWPIAVRQALNSDVATQGAAALSQVSGCLNDTVGMTRGTMERHAAECSFGNADAAQSILVIGDSIAIGWLPALRAGLDLSNWRVTAIGLESCPAAGVSTSDRLARPSFTTSCNQAREWAIDYAQKVRPTVVVLSSALGSFERLPEATAGARERAWEAGTNFTIDALSGSSRVVVVQSPPEGTSPVDCASPLTSPASCISQPTTAWVQKTTAERRSVSDSESASYLLTDRWFCSVKGCPVFVADRLVRVDLGHISDDYARYLASSFAREVVSSQR